MEVSQILAELGILEECQPAKEHWFYSLGAKGFQTVRVCAVLSPYHRFSYERFYRLPLKPPENRNVILFHLVNKLRLQLMAWKALSDKFLLLNAQLEMGVLQISW